MKEAVFIRLNKEKWKQYEGLLQNLSQQSPDVVADIYIDITNDLSFSRSHYPTSKITAYLNGLSSRLHQFIHKKKEEKFSRIITYWTQEVPEIMYRSRKELMYSFLIFFVSAIIGVFSTANDENFVRIILGDYYVDMTLNNIKNNDPMAVYKSMNEGVMFSGITYNNIKVSFTAFASGLFTSLATAYLLFTNGIMIGAFQWFFHEQGLLWDSFLTIWIHGTLEISAIIVAGAAGITMGNGWLFPKTYTRIESFKRSAKRGAKIVIGTVPMFILAGFLESFITRHTEMPNYIRFSIIFLSFYFVIAYYIIYPQMLIREKEYNKNTQHK